MFLDAKNEFSTAQTIATANSTNVIDLTPLKAAARDVGVGQPVYLVLTTPTAMAGSSPTLTVALQTDDNAAFSSAATLFTSAALTPADFAKGPIVIPLPSGAEKYLRLSYTAGGTVSAGTVTAGLSLDAQRWKAYPRNYVA
ncbi:MULTISPECIES: Bbp16 family capsid cement protein [unclassified Xanthomonas]|uniref:Bbp16 family capsid cement protein n=1 Tax=unclassified Xanthomonas TaxID=2643310 RepID=UPI002A80C166|nr:MULTISPECIES: hypothetical protein [unclassified Xanthomonas]MDY4297520.1 hypothetical protein [Xanthomonas sp. LF02-5]MDY4359314.1 hypothetical protein [Xanthomonas sp. LF04-12]